jgi:pimeloyl-ACP methyl ester carboxylesterase
MPLKASFAVLAVSAALLAGCGDEEGEDPAQQFRAEVERADVAGTEIAYYERGNGPPLLMMIGTGSAMAEWDPALLRVLAREHRLILFDYPGMGLSGPWHGSSFSSLARTAVGLLDELEIERAAVLGWSMGGFVAQRMAIEHPERVSSLVLAGTNPGGPQAVLGTPEAQAIDSDPDPTEGDILSLLYPPGEQAEGRRFLRRLETASESGEIPDDFRTPARTTDMQVAAEDPWLRSSANLRELTEIEAPTLAAAGATDPVTPPENMRLIAERIDGAELEVLPGSHAFLFQSRERFAEAVRELGD